MIQKQIRTLSPSKGMLTTLGIVLPFFKETMLITNTAARQKWGAANPFFSSGIFFI